MRRLLPTVILMSWIAVLTLVADAPPARSAPPVPGAASDTDLEPQVKALILELDAPTRARRDAAVQKLRTLGPRILPLFPAPELLPSASVRDSLVLLRGELERQQAQLSIKASVVTLQGTRTLAAWLSEITTQTGNRFDAASLSEKLITRSVTLNVTKMEFWQALEILLNVGELQLGNSSTGGGLKLEPRSKRPEPAFVTTAGPFRIAAGTAQLRPIVGNADQSLIRVPVSISPEPRLRPLFLHYGAAEVDARTSAGKNLPQFSPEAKYEIPLGEGGLRVGVQLDYITSQKMPATEISLQGKFWVTTAADQEPIRFTDLKKLDRPRSRGISRRRGGVTVTVRKVSLPADDAREREMRVEVAVTYDTGGPAFESHRTWILHNSVYLETPDKRRFALNGGFDTRLQGDGAIGLEYRFIDLPNPLPDYTFVYVAPTMIVDAPLDFRLDSVPVSKP